MTYSELVAWIEETFPDADYSVDVSTLQKVAVGRRITWEAYVWSCGLTYHAHGASSAEQIKAILEASANRGARIRLDQIDAEKLSPILARAVDRAPARAGDSSRPP